MAEAADDPVTQLQTQLVQGLDAETVEELVGMMETATVEDTGPPDAQVIEGMVKDMEGLLLRKEFSPDELAAGNHMMQQFLETSIRLLPHDLPRLQETVAHALSPQFGIYQCAMQYGIAEHDDEDTEDEESTYAEPMGGLGDDDTPGLLVLNLNHYGRCGGFTAILDRVRRRDPKLPLPMLLVLTTIVHKLHVCLASGAGQRFVGAYIVAALDLLLGASHDELKGAGKAVEEIMGMLQELSELDPDHSQQAYERASLGLAYKNFTSPYLERRLAGLNLMKDAISAAISNTQFKVRSYGSVNRCPSDPGFGFPWLDSQAMGQWLQEKGVLGHLFGPNMHNELLRRCGEIVKFLANMDMLATADIDVIWNAAKGQHESVRHSIYQVFSELAQAASEEHLEHMFHLLQAIPPGDHDMHTVRLVQFFTIGATNNLTQHGRPVRRFGIDIQWGLCQEDVSVVGEVSGMAYNNMCQLINWPILQDLRPSLFTQCLQQIRAGRSAVVCLKLMGQMISAYGDGGNGGHSSAFVIQFLETQHKLRDTILASLNDYKDEVELWHKKHSPGATIDWPRVVVNSGRKVHMEEVRARLDLLHDVLTTRDLREDIVLTLPMLAKVWDCCIIRAVCVEEQQMVLDWLGRLAHAGVLEGGVLQDLYTVRLPEMQGRRATQAWLVLYKRLLVACNHKRVFVRNGMPYVRTRPVEGMQPLWVTALTAEDGDVGADTMQFLIHLTLHVDDTAPAAADPPQQDYIATCMANMLHAAAFLQGSKEEEPVGLQEGPGTVMVLCSIDSRELADRVVHRAVQMLAELLNEYALTCPGDLTALGVEAHGHSVGEQEITVQIQTLQSAAERRPLRMHLNDTMLTLRRAVAALMGIEPQTGVAPEQRVRLVSNGKEVRSDSDHVTLRQAKVVDGQVFHMVMRQPTQVDNRRASNSDVNGGREKDGGAGVPHLILGSERYFGRLFHLLQLGPAHAQQLWGLLLLLPTSTGLKQGLTRLGDTPPWPSLVDASSPYALLYSLQIVSALARDTTWLQGFEQRGGVQHLLSILLGGAGECPRAVQVAWMGLLAQLLVRCLLGPDWARDQPRTAALPSLQASAMQWVHGPELVDRLLVLLQAESQVAAHEDGQDTSMAGHLVLLLVAACHSSTATLQHLMQHNALPTWLRTVLLESERTDIRQSVGQGLVALGTMHDGPEASGLAGSLLQLLLSFLPTIPDHCSTSQEYFEALQQLVEGVSSSSPQDWSALMVQLAQRLRAHPVGEGHGLGQVDHVLVGLCNLLRCVLRHNPQLVERAALPLPEHGDLINFVFWHCLFDIPTREHHGPHSPPLCKTDASRAAALRLLLVLGQASPRTYTVLAALVYAQHTQAVPEKVPTWVYCPKAWQKASCGYVGLKNLGATCYMNSIMQQFFMAPRFRQAVLACPVDPARGDNALIMHQLQRTFAYLQESEKKSYDSRAFCNVYKYEGEPVNVAMQMDVDEFFNMLFDRLEDVVKKTPHSDMLKQQFGGKLAQQIISKDDACRHVSQREEDFFALQCEVKNKKSIQESLELYVKGETLEGDNKYQCGTCEKKVDAVKRACIKELPQTLILHLKRFEFDMEQMRRIKLNDYCEFSQELNMEPYTLEGLERREAEANGEVYTGLVRDASYYHYTLYGVLVHTGTADSGHYYSFIKERKPLDSSMHEGQWLHFNDSQVDYFNTKDLAAQAYGGPEVVTQWDSATQREVRRTINKPYSAYMLFYERTAGLNPPQANTDSAVSLTGQGTATVPEEIVSGIWQENMEFWRDWHVFDDTYFDFMLQLIKNAPEGTTEEQTLQRLQTATGFYLHTFLRSKDKPNLQEWTASLRALYSECYPGCVWLLQYVVSQAGYVRQLLMACNVAEAAEAFCTLLLHVVQIVRTQEAGLYAQSMDGDQKPAPVHETIPEDAPHVPPPPPPVTRSVVVALVDCLVDMLCEAQHHWRSFERYFMLLLGLAGLGIEEQLLLLHRRLPARLADLLLAETSPLLQEGEKRKKLGDKYAQPNWQPVLDIMALLLLQCAPPARAAEQPENPHLSQEDMALISHNNFDALMRLAKISEPAGKTVGTILAHLCDGHIEYSDKAVQGVVHMLDRMVADSMAPFFHASTVLLALNDEHADARLASYLHIYCLMVGSNAGYPTNMVLAISYLHTVVQAHPHAADWLMDNLNAWLAQWLVMAERLNVVTAIERLVVCVVGGDEFALQHDQLVRKGERGPPLDLPVEATHRRQAIYRHLLAHMADAVRVARRDATDDGADNAHIYRVAGYLRLLRLTFHTDEDRLAWAQQYQVFAQLYLEVESNNMTTDDAKRELTALWLEMCTDQRECINTVLSYQGLWDKIMSYFISLDNTDNAILYNRHTLAKYYHLLHLLATASPEFLERWALHQNFSWAVLNMAVFASYDYAEACDELLQLVELCCSMQQYRNRLMQQVSVVQKNQRPSLHFVKVMGWVLASEQDFLDASVQGRRIWDHLEWLAAKSKNAPELQYSTLGLMLRWVAALKASIPVSTQDRNLAMALQRMQAVLGESTELLAACVGLLQPTTHPALHARAIDLLDSLAAFCPMSIGVRLLDYFANAHTQHCQQGGDNQRGDYPEANMLALGHGPLTASEDTFYRPYYHMLHTMVERHAPRTRAALVLNKYMAVETVPLAFTQVWDLWAPDWPGPDIRADGLPDPPASGTGEELWGQVQLRPEMVSLAQQDDVWVHTIITILMSRQTYLTRTKDMLPVICKAMHTLQQHDDDDGEVAVHLRDKLQRAVSQTPPNPDIVTEFMCRVLVAAAADGLRTRLIAEGMEQLLGQAQACLPADDVFGRKLVGWLLLFLANAPAGPVDPPQ